MSLVERAQGENAFHNQEELSPSADCEVLLEGENVVLLLSSASDSISGGSHHLEMCLQSQNRLLKRRLDTPRKLFK